LAAVAGCPSLSAAAKPAADAANDFKNVRRVTVIFMSSGRRLNSASSAGTSNPNLSPHLSPNLFVSSFRTALEPGRLGERLGERSRCSWSQPAPSGRPEQVRAVPAGIRFFPCTWLGSAGTARTCSGLHAYSTRQGQRSQIRGVLRFTAWGPAPAWCPPEVRGRCASIPARNRRRTRAATRRAPVPPTVFRGGFP